MKSRKTNLLSLAALLIAMSFALAAAPCFAQNGNPTLKTNSKILYHDGPVMQATSHVYLIWYGNWASGPGNNSQTQSILTDFVVHLGSSPYFLINTGYPDANGATSNGALIYAGVCGDAYSHGLALTDSDIQGVIAGALAASQVPLDSAGIYIVIASADVTDLRPDGSTFCSPPFSPRHGYGQFSSTTLKYAFIGNAARCPSVLVPQSPSPNGDIYADAMASTLAHALDEIVTSPLGTGGPFGGWYDRYGLENADKCQGTFGETYITANGTRANMRLGQRDYLIQQNWVNVRRGYCGLSLPTP